MFWRPKRESTETSDPQKSSSRIQRPDGRNSVASCCVCWSFGYCTFLARRWCGHTCLWHMRYSPMPCRVERPSIVDLLLERNTSMMQDLGDLGSAAHAACFAGSMEILLILERKEANHHAKRATSNAYFKHLAKQECMSLSTSSAS